MAGEADFAQLEKFMKSWQDAFSDFDDFLKKFLLEMAFRWQAKTKTRHQFVYSQTGKTIDTAAMINSWFVGEIAVRGSNFEVAIGNSQNYSSFIEFGARNVDGSWREGFFIMTIPIDEVQSEMPTRFDAAFRQYLQSKGAV